MVRLVTLGSLAASLIGILPYVAIGADEVYERSPVNYSTALPKDATAVIAAKLANGSLKLEGDEKQVVRTLLQAFGIPEESQMLLFSKTSLQRERISPSTPRALYFTDTVYIGWCPGGLVEVTAIDPVLGPVFYTFDPSPIRKNWQFNRDADCLRCHGGALVRGIPGIVARSVYTDAAGQPLTSLGTELVDSSTPFENRYGGWYVTGTHGNSVHRGNLTISNDQQPNRALLAKTSNLKNLNGLFDYSRYLVETSDLVALLVFEHQLTVQNALTKANQQCLTLLDYQQKLQRALNNPVSTEPEFESVENAFTDAVEQVVDALLYKDEAPLPSGGVQGVGGFSEVFGRRPGASDLPHLKELDLKHRVFKYRCSYMIQTPVFEGLQPTLRSRVLRKLHRVLTDSERYKRYAYLEPEEREVIREIVARTVKDLPPNWRSR